MAETKFLHEVLCKVLEFTKIRRIWIKSKLSLPVIIKPIKQTKSEKLETCTYTLLTHFFCLVQRFFLRKYVWKKLLSIRLAHVEAKMTARNVSTARRSHMQIYMRGLSLSRSYNLILRIGGPETTGSRVG